MQGENGCSIFGSDLKRVEIAGAIREAKCDAKRINNLMHDQHVVFEPDDNLVITRICSAKRNALKFRACDKFDPNAIVIDGFQFANCPGPLLTEPLAKDWPIRAFYLMDHVFVLVRRLINAAV